MASGKGELRIPLNHRAMLPILRGQYFVVTGGPYRNRPNQMLGVKMAVEIDMPCTISIPTKDFHTPDRGDLYRGLEKAVNMVLAGEPIYVGCMGGIGRTGLFLAVLVKSFGIKNPVQFVRKNYSSHAVETADQMKFVKDFAINPRVRAKIKQARRQQYLYFWKWFRLNLTKKVTTS